MAKLIINEENKKSRIEPEIYGHFSEHLGRCIYEGIYVGEKSEIPNVNGMRTDVVDALKELKVPVLRWPGGCFADEYHWMDGIGPKEKRKKMINTHWGGVVEDNSFGTHEYMELCRQIGCKTYVNGNLGSGTVREMSEWVEYMTFEGVSPMADLRKENGHEAPWKVDYFGVGNENWGCGGNMTPEYYANEYRRYQTYVRNYHPDRPIKKICCGANVADYYWTKGVLNTAFDHAEQWHGFMDGLSLHYYVHPEGWEIKGSSTDFDADVWYKTLSKALYMETLIERHGAIMDEYDPDKKVGMIVDEWGTWYTCEPGTNPGFLYQQNTVRDALVAGIMEYMQKKGYATGGFDAYVSTKVIAAAGVSSSASFEMLVCAITNHFFNEGKLEYGEYARAGQYAENVYWKKASGLMDQMACAAGGPILLDFSDKVSRQIV